LILSDQNRVAGLNPQNMQVSAKEGAGVAALKLKSGEKLMSAISLTTVNSIED
jgi:hypothetical protein